MIHGPRYTAPKYCSSTLSLLGAFKTACAIIIILSIRNFKEKQQRRTEHRNKYLKYRLRSGGRFIRIICSCMKEDIPQQQAVFRPSCHAWFPKMALPEAACRRSWVSWPWGRDRHAISRLGHRERVARSRRLAQTWMATAQHDGRQSSSLWGLERDFGSAATWGRSCQWTKTKHAQEKMRLDSGTRSCRERPPTAGGPRC
ncbi:hypothetical protein C8R45DRAFT_980164 [Mycena sanguinolenta]|nr:hypothetical protein C8R45DRAFT_980164 [Mycena sanguinolenta]